MAYRTGSKPSKGDWAVGMKWLAVDCITEEFAAFLAAYLQGEVDRGSQITAEIILNAYIEWEYHGIR